MVAKRQYAARSSSAWTAAEPPLRCRTHLPLEISTSIHHHKLSIFAKTVRGKLVSTEFILQNTSGRAISIAWFPYAFLPNNLGISAFVQFLRALSLSFLFQILQEGGHITTDALLSIS
jgi:hypothetical protein